MRYTRSLIITAAAALATVITAPVGAAAKPAPPSIWTDYTVAGAVDTHVTGVNDYGQIVGYYTDGSGTSYGFYDNHTSGAAVSTLIPDASATSTQATSVNDSQLVTGVYTTPDGVEHGYVWTGTSFIPLEDPYPPASGRYGIHVSQINNNGLIVGHYYTVYAGGVTYPDGVTDDAIVFHGFRYTLGGAFTTIDVPAASTAATNPHAGTRVFGANSAGTVVGTYTYLLGDMALDVAFSATAGSTMKVTNWVDTNGKRGSCNWTTATGINDRGVIVGNGGNACGEFNNMPWIRTGGKMTVFRYPNAQDTQVAGINNAGLIWGTYAPGVPGLRGFTYQP